MPSLEAAEEAWRLTLDNAPVGISLVDLEGRFLRVNDQLCALVGRTREELLAMSLTELTHPDDVEADRQGVTRLLSGEASSFRLRKRYLHAEGHPVWVDLSVAVVLGPDGRPHHTVGYVLDLTDEMAARAEVEQVNAELSEKTDRLQESNADLEAFAMLASHDLKAPLSTVLGYLQLLEGEYAESLDAQATDWIGRAVSAAQRMAALVDSLLTLSRSDHAVQPVPVSLGDLVVDVCADLEPLIRELEAVVEVDERTLVVWGDPARLRQVVQNLVHNALKYHHPDRTPEIRVHVAAEDDSERSWLVTVDDNCPTIPPERREQVFGLFERLGAEVGHGAEGGHGIGLASCRRIVHRHGGRIWIEDTPHGEGNRFRFTLRR